MTISLELTPEEATKVETYAKQHQKSVQEVFKEIVSTLEIEPTRSNKAGLAMLQTLMERQKDRPYTEGSSNQHLLREARAGAMYGYAPTK